MIQIDIDMPKRCEECPLCVDYDCIIHKRVTDEYYDGLNEQYAHCPLFTSSAEPTQNNTSNTLKSLDCISRQALCEYALNQKDKSVTPNDIMRFPSAQPERKRGHWIEVNDSNRISKEGAICLFSAQTAALKSPTTA